MEEKKFKELIYTINMLEESVNDLVVNDLIDFNSVKGMLILTGDLKTQLLDIYMED